MSGRPLTRCADVAPLLVFYACDEVDPQERKQIDAHLAVCPTCAEQLGEESVFQTTFSGASQPADELDPTGALLAQCRSELSEHLDDYASSAGARALGAVWLGASMDGRASGVERRGPGFGWHWGRYAGNSVAGLERRRRRLR